MESKSLNILYVAPGINIQGRDGGAVHVSEVSRGLKELGHQIHLIVKGDRYRKTKPQLVDDIEVYPVLKWIPARLLQWVSFPAIYKLARRIKPDIIIERYYNFGGGGILSAHLLKIPSMLEVNSPVIDHQGSAKAIIDTLLIFKPMKRWRETLCRWSSRIITPLPSILPSSIPKEKVVRLSWGANVQLFTPDKASGITLRKELGIENEIKLFVFIGSFRKWHGLPDLIVAAHIIHKEHKRKDIAFLLIGGGPETASISSQIKKWGLENMFILRGRIPHNEMPVHLSTATAGIAPFNTRYHPQLKLGFYWSPLKIFEFMAAGLPVVTIDIPPLNEIVRHQQEGLLYKEGDTEDLADKILSLADNVSLAEKMGQKARNRVEENFSWQIHCQKLDSIMKELIASK